MRASRRRAGFSLAEMVVVILVAGVTASVVVPRFALSDSQRAYTSALRLADDLDRVRERAIERETNARLLFDATGGAYDGFLDADHDGSFAYTGAERDSLAVMASRAMEPPVRFGRGARAPVPGFPAADAVSFDGAAITFDARGLLYPMGDRGVIYLHADDEPDALAAVTVTGAGQVRVWRWSERERWE